VNKLLVTMVTAMAIALVGGAAWGDHTAEDARATSARLEAILHPKKPKAKTKTPKMMVAQAPSPAVLSAPPQQQQQQQPPPPHESGGVGGILVSLIAHAMAFIAQ
jgi:hypothetical protein